MSKFWKYTGVATVVVVVAAFGFTALVSAQEGSPPAGGDGGRPRSRQEQGPKGWMSEYRDDLQAAMADALGLSVEELESALAEGKKLDEIAAEQGVAKEDLQAAMQSAQEDILAQAVADGVLTQEEADKIAEHMADGGGPGRGPGRGPNRRGSGPRGNRPRQGPALSNPGWIEDYQDDLQSALANVLGLSVEELDAAKAEGVKLDEIAAEQGVELEDVKAAMQSAHEDILAQAVADGALTQEEADAIAEHQAEGNGRCRGPQGPRGNRRGQGPAPGGPAPAPNQNGFGSPLSTDA